MSKGRSEVCDRGHVVRVAGGEWCGGGGGRRAGQTGEAESGTVWLAYEPRSLSVMSLSQEWNECLVGLVCCPPVCVRACVRVCVCLRA